MLLLVDEAGGSHELSTSPTRIGTDDGANIRLTAPGVEPEHAMVVRRGEAWVLCASAALSIGDVTVEPAEERVLCHGARIAIGSATLRCQETLTEVPGDEVRTAELALGMLARAELAGAGGDSWGIMIVGGAPLGRKVLLPKEGALTVGRGEAATLMVDDPTASRLHVEVRLADGGIKARESRGGRRGDSPDVEVRHAGGGASVRLGGEKLAREAWTAWPKDRHLRFGRTVLACLPPRSEALEEIVGTTIAASKLVQESEAAPESAALEVPSAGAAPIAAAPEAKAQPVVAGARAAPSPWIFRGAIAGIALVALALLAWILRG